MCSVTISPSTSQHRIMRKPDPSRRASFLIPDSIYMVVKEMASTAYPFKGEGLAASIVYARSDAQIAVCLTGWLHEQQVGQEDIQGDTVL